MVRKTHFRQRRALIVVDTNISHEIIPADGWDAFFDGVKTVHLFKFPLQLALSVSIICLFLPTFLMTKDMNRRVLLQV